LLPILLKVLLVLFYSGLGLLLLSTVIGIPGNWILVAVAIVTAVVTGFSTLSPSTLLLCVGLAVLGELIESVLGVVIVARRGGSKLGIVGSIAGGLAGVLLGAGLVPPVGSVVLGFVGAFLGAVFGEIIHQPDLDIALRVGFWSFIGRMAAIAAKLSVGCVIFWLIIRSTWP
jgi:uncharacterized protein YqgC (DUF456 family)